MQADSDRLGHANDESLKWPALAADTDVDADAAAAVAAAAAAVAAVSASQCCRTKNAKEKREGESTLCARFACQHQQI